MNAGHCIEIANPYNWLPGYGETRVDISTQAGNLSVVIEYDGKGSRTEKKVFVFSGVVSFSQTVFPGVNSSAIEYNSADKTLLDRLVEFPDSEVSSAWTRHFAGVLKIRHFRIFFMSANIELVVFARDFLLQDIPTG